MLRLYAAGLVAILCAAACAENAPEQPPAEFAIESTRMTLENGLEVVVVPDHSAPTVTALMAFRAGAFVEAEAQSGYSHLLEHMLWKGSADVPDPVLFRERLRALGALTNATTGDELMTYFAILPRENLDAGLALLASGLRDPLLDAETLATEIEVVLAEYDLSDSDWDSVANRRMRQLLFPGQPNRKNPAGNRDAIRMATPAALRELYTTYHVPNNALIVLVGDVDGESGAAVAERHFGSWERGADPFAEHPVSEPRALAFRKVEILRAEVSGSSLVIGFLGPDIRRDFGAAVAADVLAEVTTLSDQRFRSIVGAPAVIGASLRHTAARDRGVLQIGLDMAAGFEREAIERLQDMLPTLSNWIVPHQVSAARDELWARRFFGADGNLELAFQLARGWAITDLEYGAEYLDALYDLDHSAVEDVARQYIAQREFAAVLLLPKDDANRALPFMAQELQLQLENLW